MGQAGGVEPGREGVVGVHVGHAHQRVGDHGDGVGRHERDVVGGAAQRQRVVGQRGQAQRVAHADPDPDPASAPHPHAPRGPDIALVVRLVHLQRHDLLLGRVESDVVGVGLPLLRRAGLLELRVLPALVLAVVERGEGQHVEEEERGAHGDGDAQLGGVVARVLHHQGHPSLLAVPRLVAALAVVRRRHGRPLGVERPRLVVAVGPLGGQGVLRGLGRRHLGGGGRVVEHVVQVVQVRHQVLPEGHLGGAVVVAHARLQADVQVQLVLGVVLGPGHLLEAVGLGVDELGVLGHWLVGIPGKDTHKKTHHHLHNEFDTTRLEQFISSD